MAKSKKILFLLSGNISTTPRAIKAIELAVEAGYSVELWMVNRAAKWKTLDTVILERLHCKYTYLTIIRNESIGKWLTANMLNVGARILSAVGLKSTGISALASSKVNCLYQLCANKLKRSEADLIYGFSSMVYPAWICAKSIGVPFAFDMEDYHPWENVYYKNIQRERHRREMILQNILPDAGWVSFASPMIQKQTEKLLEAGRSQLKVSFTLNNTFRASDFVLEPSSDGKVQFVWFSQTVSYGRGLELILPYIMKFKDKVELTIIGNMDEHFRQDYLSINLENIHILPAMCQSDLHRRISQYDIGLATEIFSDLEDNKALCLSNKIFTYLLSGLFIFATDTPAQKDFIESHPAHGMVVTPDAQSLESGFQFMIDNISKIRVEKATRFDAARKFSWENEQKYLLREMRKVLEHT